MEHEKEIDNPSHSNSPQHWIRWTPWLGIISIFTIFSCAVASGAILGVSHGDLVEEWMIKPAVLLAILSAASNIAFSTALATGIAVRFWLHASQGALLTQLHYIWDHGRGIGLIHALRAGSEARRVAIIATLGYIVQFSTGPLFQRSTYQLAREYLEHTPMFLNISTHIPDGHFGVIDEDGDLVATRRVMSQARDWYRNSTITTLLEPGYTCNGGTCLGHVTGAGFTYTCTPLPPRQIAMLDSSTDNESVFLVQPVWAESSPGTNTPQINITTTVVSSLSNDCTATLTGHLCTVKTAVVSYPITISNNTLSLRYPSLLSPGPDGTRTLRPYQSPGDRYRSPSGTLAGPLRGLYNFIDGWLADNATKTYNTAVNKTLYDGSGWIADVFFRSEPWDYNATTNPIIQCGLTWDSPTEWVLLAMYDFMFRVALKTAGGGPADELARVGTVSRSDGGEEEEDRKTFVMERFTRELIFGSDVRYLSAALVATGVCLALLVILVWGWWRLEAKVTLSPLETARVFGGSWGGGNWSGTGGEGGGGGDGGLPVMVKANLKGGTIEDILKAVKDVELKIEEDGRGVVRSKTVDFEQMGGRHKGGFRFGGRRLDRSDSSLSRGITHVNSM